MFVIACFTVLILWLISVDLIHFRREPETLEITVETRQIQTAVRRLIAKVTAYAGRVFPSQHKN